MANCKLNFQKYALKVLDKQMILESGFDRLIMREKEITYKLDHPNIVRLESYFHDSNYCYFVFELCNHGNLRNLISLFGKLSLKLTRFFTMQMINALEYLQRHSIVHRDLKPQNILLDDSFHVKIADFGASKKIDISEVHEQLEKDPELMNESDTGSDSSCSSEDSYDMFAQMQKQREHSKAKVSSLTS